MEQIQDKQEWKYEKSAGSVCWRTVPLPCSFSSNSFITRGAIKRIKSEHIYNWLQEIWLANLQHSSPSQTLFGKVVKLYNKHATTDFPWARKAAKTTWEWDSGTIHGMAIWPVGKLNRYDTLVTRWQELVDITILRRKNWTRHACLEKVQNDTCSCALCLFSASFISIHSMPWDWLMSLCSELWLQIE